MIAQLTGSDAQSQEIRKQEKLCTELASRSETVSRLEKEIEAMVQQSGALQAEMAFLLHQNRPSSDRIEELRRVLTQEKPETLLVSLTLHSHVNAIYSCSCTGVEAVTLVHRNSISKSSSSWNFFQPSVPHRLPRTAINQHSPSCLPSAAHA